jgi:hypothetical protein
LGCDLPSEFIRARKSFCAAWKCAGMGLLSSVGADMASLVFQTVESLIAKRALVGPGEILSRLVRLLRGVLQQRRHEAHGSSSHGGWLGGRSWLLLLEL